MRELFVQEMLYSLKPIGEIVKELKKQTENLDENSRKRNLERVRKPTVS